MVRLKDYQQADGSVDWLAYRNAVTADHASRIASGEICQTCGGTIPKPEGVPCSCRFSSPVSRRALRRYRRWLAAQH